MCCGFVLGLVACSVKLVIMVMPSGSHESLIVWKKATDFCLDIYRLTKKFPKEELYGLTSQMRRGAVSVPSNIAEGKRRGGDKEFQRFLRIAFGSGAELETQLLIAFRLEYTEEKEYLQLRESLSEIMRLLNALIRITDT